MEVARLQVAFEATGQSAVQRAIDTTDKGIHRLADSSVAGANRMGSAFANAGNLIKLAVGAVVAKGVFDLGKSFISLNANAEQYKISLETVTGSQAKANALFKDLQKFAAATPFEFPELVQASINLEAFGLQTTDWIDTVGNTASAMGKSVDQVTQAVLDAATGSYERLKELGISAQVEGDKLNIMYMKNGKQVVETVDKTNKEVILSTIKGIWNQKYEGAMRKQSHTFNGMLSTFKDNVNITMAAAARPIFNFAKDGLDAANRFFDRFNAKMQSGLDPVHAGLSALHTTLDQTLGKGMGDAIDGVLRGIVSGIGAVSGAIRTLAGDLASGDISGFFSDLGVNLATLASKGLEIPKIAVNVGEWVLSEGIPDLWGWFLKQIGVGPNGFIGTGDGTEQHIVTLSDVMVNVGDFFVEAGADLAGKARDAIQGWLDTHNDPSSNLVTLAGLGVDVLDPIANLTSADVSGWIQGRIDALTEISAELKEWKLIIFGPDKVEAGPNSQEETKSTLQKLIDTYDAINAKMEWIASMDPTPKITIDDQTLPNINDWLQKWVTGNATISVPFTNWEIKLAAWKDIQWDAGVPDLVASIKTKIDELGDLIDNTDILKGKGSDLIAGLQDGVVERWKQLSAWFGHLGDYAEMSVGNVASSLKQKGIDLIAGVISGKDEQYKILKTWLSYLGTYAFDAIGTVTGSLYQKGVDLIQGLMNGWHDKSLELGAWAANLPAWVAGQVVGAIGALYDVGADLVQGLINGINDRLGPLLDIIDRIKSALNSISGSSGQTATGSGLGGGGTLDQKAGGGYITSAMTLVGERGPEIISAPRGSYVYNASRTAGMLAGSSGQTINVIFGAGSYVGPGAMREIKRMAADGAVGIVDQRQAAHSVGAMRR